MIIGIISDIHSNYWALRKMLRVERNVTYWLCLGDSVGLLPMVNETLELIQNKNIISIRGDHEEALLAGTPLPLSRSGTEVLSIQRRIITPKNRIFLRGLPRNKRIVLDDVWFSLNHSLHKSYTKDKYFIDMSAIEAQYPGDTVLYGHTHLPMVWYGKCGMIGNPGSLGFPIREDKMSTYAIFDTTSMKMTLKELSVDWEPIIEMCIKQHYPSRIIELLEDYT